MWWHRNCGCWELSPLRRSAPLFQGPRRQESSPNHRHRRRLRHRRKQQHPLLCPRLELARYSARVWRQAHDLVRIEGCDSCRGWVRAFERWQLVSKLLGDLDVTSDFSVLDPLLPCREPPHDLAYQSLHADLSHLDNMNAELAEEVAPNLHAFGTRMAAAVRQIATGPHSSSSSSSTNEISIAKVEAVVRKWDRESHSIETTQDTGTALYSLSLVCRFQ